jgi:long-subunit acyl-CoA synthetase (AMP-forming)
MMEENRIRMTFPSKFGETLRKHGKCGAYAYAGEDLKSWETAGKEIYSLMAMLEKNGICPGDKVAILSSNMPNWAISFFAVTFMGAVAVPILPDFSNTEVGNVLEHSESRAIFISSSLLARIEGFKSDHLKRVILMEDYSLLSSEEGGAVFEPDSLPARHYEVDEEDLASIIYTSGTTGRSKGVMLTHKNIVFNAMKGMVIQPIDETDRFLSVLPLSHTYENTLGLILPMLAGANPKKFVFDSTGPKIEGIELIIHNPDKETGEGEIWAKGPNVMKGYYKEPEMTKEVLTPDGWFRTGDLGALDSKNNLYIKGRLKNMIVGSSGENIYPEEIESVINNFRFVVESLVIQQKGKLVAYVHLNMEELEKKYHHLKEDMSRQFEEKKKELLAELKDYVNSKVNKFSQINKVVNQPSPFQKTATLKIKRFLYSGQGVK